MSQRQRPEYEFADALPVEPVAPGTSLLVTGPSLAGTREIVMQLLACQESEGLVFLTTDVRGTEAIERFESAGCRYDRSRMAVIDCTQNSTADTAANVHAVSSPRDLTGLGIAFSRLYEDLYGAGIERVRTGLYTLEPLLMYTDEVQPLYRFLHTLTGRIRTAEGLGIVALDPDTQDEQIVRTIAQPFEGRIEVREREDGDRQIRVRGLDGQPSGWQPVDL